MSIRVGFDIDGVLADFRTAFRAAARQCLRLPDANGEPELSRRDIERIWAFVARTENWWMAVEPYEPAELEQLYQSARAGQWEVVFVTKRPPSAGECVQVQTQLWLRQYGYPLASVVTVPGSRGDLANALRLDVVVDDQFVNCAEVIGASTTKALLMLREPDPIAARHATDRGIGVVSSLGETLPVLERLREVLPSRSGRPVRLMDWFPGAR